MYLVVDPKGFLRTDDGRLFAILEANSPENRLRWCDHRELDALHDLGVNTIYATVFGGDDRDVHPFRNRARPLDGLNPDTLARWKAYADAWHAKGPDRGFHILASEMENHPELDDQAFALLLDAILQVFGTGRSRPLIIDFEEVGRFLKDRTRRRLEMIRDRIPFAIRALHNRLDGEGPWVDFAGTGLVQLCSVQASSGEIGWRIDAAHAEGIVSGTPWAVYASEVADGPAVGFQPGDADRFRRFALRSHRSSGTGCYYGKFDQSPEALQHDRWRSVYQAVTAPTVDMVLANPGPVLWSGSRGAAPNDHRISRLGAGFEYRETRYPVVGQGSPKQVIQLRTGLSTAAPPQDAEFRLRISSLDYRSATMEVQPLFAVGGVVKAPRPVMSPARIAFDLVDFNPANTAYDLILSEVGVR